MRRIVTLLTLLLCVAACAAEPVQMKVFDRGIETWQPDPSSLSFDWARKLTDGRSAPLFSPTAPCRETMELARRLDLQVHHLYWDSSGTLSGADWWPYRDHGPECDPLGPSQSAGRGAGLGRPG